MYRMADLGLLRKFLSVEFLQTTQGTLLHQTSYVQLLFTKYDMHNATPSFIPISKSLKLTKDSGTLLIDPWKYQHFVGELNYLTKSRWEIGYVVSILSKFMHQPQELHFNTTFIVLRYL